ncbi:MAG: 23S rRNA (adenine(2503)-C(2))-methyltransferase RlmN [Acidobacteria bacterium]|nr:23S rRNA (adenine(2503)-C(2))-methyltransferase RlmN [Acidobacteriota bacterium]MCA1627181.1 23S rRNA (adenine(2503)-C(2))-methyltransferase RlmN [Acidobacteriota bacterium]
MKEIVELTGLSQPELISFVETLGEPAYRGRQIFAALQHRRLRSFDEITDLSKDLRARLNDVARPSSIKIESRYISSDGTRRYLMKTHDSLPVETVFIPEEHRDTICFSSQSGCPLQCTFCLTAQLGLLRSLTAGEIVEQVLIALNDAYGVGVKPPRGTNLVGMGAGEPFLNFDNLLKALRVMADRDGLYIVPNRVTISTAGIVPKILELAEVADRPHLAISLAAPTDELRNQLMPINKRWPLEELLKACKVFEKSLKPGERFTFEYVMLAGINDSEEQARQLANLLNRHGLKVKVNLIPHNPAEPLPYRPSADETVDRFKQTLEAKGVHTYVRRPRGRDIFAACGQLAARQEKLNIATLNACKDTTTPGVTTR